MQGKNACAGTAKGGMEREGDAITSTVHQFAESLGNAIDAKDPSTWMHSEEVAVVGQLIALSLGFSPRQADVIHVAGHLHDIGKIGIPDRLLRKQGPLDAAEWAIMQRHPEMGEAILRPVRFLSGQTGIAAIVRHHHERFDGSGYPDGLRGAAIPLGARIVTVADSVSAMLQSRPYRPGMPFETVLDEVRRCVGTQFDPVVVEAFLRVRDAVASWLDGMRMVEPRTEQSPLLGAVV